MFLKLTFCVIALASTALAEEYTPGSDEYLLNALVPLLSPLNAFDGPAYISNATTRPNKNTLPTVDQMMYYNYYAESAYYVYDHDDLTCDSCLEFKDDVTYHEVIKNTFHDTLALVTLSEDREEIVVTFRGTANVWNVVLDALLILGRDSNTPKQVKIHRGFYIATMSLYDDVVETVADLLNENPGFKVVLTGHSLGGAMARITYFFFADRNLFPGVEFELYTYGEPRVGNKYFAEFMNCQPITTARVVARADLFPHIMPTSILGTRLLGDYYVHAQTEYWINGEDCQKFCRQTTYEDQQCSISLGPAYSALDHFFYFDVNYVYSFGQPLAYAALPFKLLDPVGVLPPLPKPIEKLIGGIAGGVAGALVPALG
ncbi:lipase-like [Bradysia coprophila]|uniref:lipase-like n=1 Tax=Bradysia coprophila TaxID=38358 RepID=UPI00187DD32A|nr:lipase-like [Bradysia coprophila]